MNKYLLFHRSVFTIIIQQTLVTDQWVLIGSEWKKAYSILCNFSLKWVAYDFFSIFRLQVLLYVPIDKRGSNKIKTVTAVQHSIYVLFCIPVILHHSTIWVQQLLERYNDVISICNNIKICHLFIIDMEVVRQTHITLYEIRTFGTYRSRNGEFWIDKALWIDYSLIVLGLSCSVRKIAIYILCYCFNKWRAIFIDVQAFKALLTSAASDDQLTALGELMYQVGCKFYN